MSFNYIISITTTNNTNTKHIQYLHHFSAIIFGGKQLVLMHCIKLHTQTKNFAYRIFIRIHCAGGFAVLWHLCKCFAFYSACFSVPKLKFAINTQSKNQPKQTRSKQMCPMYCKLCVYIRFSRSLSHLMSEWLQKFLSTLCVQFVFEAQLPCIIANKTAKRWKKKKRFVNVYISYTVSVPLQLHTICAHWTHPFRRRELCKSHQQINQWTNGMIVTARAMK